MASLWGHSKMTNDIDYVVIANKNYDIEMSVALEIARKVPVDEVHRLDNVTGEWVELPGYRDGCGREQEQVFAGIRYA